MSENSNPQGTEGAKSPCECPARKALEPFARKGESFSPETHERFKHGRITVPFEWLIEAAKAYSAPSPCAELRTSIEGWQRTSDENRQIAKGLREKNQALSEQLESDRTAIAEVVTRLKRELGSRFWLTQGRGSYEWDDDRYREEFGAAIRAINKAVEPLEKVAADWTGCPCTSAEVAQARIDLRQERDRLREENERLKETLEVLANTDTVKMLTASMEDIKAGRVIDFDKIDLLAECERERESLRSQLAAIQEEMERLKVLGEEDPVEVWAERNGYRARAEGAERKLATAQKANGELEAELERHATDRVNQRKEIAAIQEQAEKLAEAPGGHCTDCGKCDEFLGKHEHEDLEGKGE